MSFSDLTFEICLIDSDGVLGSYVLDIDPEPGTEFMLEGQSYLVMERRHRYALKMNRYELSQILLSVKAISKSSEKSWLDGQWVMGDMACQYNARSPFIRCAVNPDGPCNDCSTFLPIGEAISPSSEF